MGVKRLETFAERNGHICYDVDLKDMVAAYIKKEKRKPVIVVDLLSTYRYVYKDISFIAGGQMKEINEAIAKFYKSLADLGAELVIFVDGLVAPAKVTTYIERRNNEVKKITNIFRQLESNPFSFYEDFYSQTSNGHETIRILTLNSNHKFFRSILECDLEMAKYAEDNQCFAILAQDTDFLIYRGARHYLSMKHFNFVNMTTKEYSQKNLSRKLHLPIEHLPILASLIGNDIVEQDDLRDFHVSMCENRSYRRNYIDFTQNFYNVADFINHHFSLRKSYHETLTAMCAEAFGTADYPDFKKSIDIYNTRYPHKMDAINKSLGENWIKVQNLAVDFNIRSQIMTQMYGVILKSVLYSGAILEDYVNKPFLPAFVLLSTLRKRVYGVLLQEKPLIGNKPHMVDELAVTGFDTCNGFKPVPIISPQFKHSGLVRLWTSNDDAIYAEKISLFHFCFKIGKEITDLKERHLILPTAALKYLFAEGFKILKWEMEALVVAMVLLDFYSVEQLRAIPEFPLDTRAINLYTVVNKSYNTALMANLTCGSPLNREEHNPLRYQDGKLFHLKYREAKKEKNFLKMCENNESVIITSKKIIEILNM